MSDISLDSFAMKLAKKDIDWTLLSQELLKNPELTNLTINVPNRILKTTKQNLTKFYSTGGHTQGAGISNLFKELHHVKANQYILGLNLRFKFYWKFLSIYFIGLYNFGCRLDQTPLAQ